MQPIGTPCWLDLTTDLDRALPFYEGVLGWGFEELAPEFGGWRLALVDGDPVAAIGPGTPRDWQVFLRSADVDADVQRAVAAGASVPLPPGDVGEMGRAAQIADPGGATVGLWQAGSHSGFTITGKRGCPVWFEVNTRDSEAVRDFFSGLFDLEHQKMDAKRYFTLHADGRPRYGVLHMNAQWEGMASSWMSYFAVPDVDAAAVAEHGGLVEYAPFDTPFGRIAICRDPCGTPLTLITSA